MAAALTFPRSRAARDAPARAEGVDPRFSPDSTLLWTQGRIVYADEARAPKPSRLAAFLLRARDVVWYEWLKQPRVTREDRPVVLEKNAMRFSREEARRLCRDEMDCISGFPVDAEPFGDEMFLNPTLCRPLWKPHREMDAAHRALYTADAREQVCGALGRENAELRAQLEGCTLVGRDDMEELRAILTTRQTTEPRL